MTEAVFDTTVFIDAYEGQGGAVELLRACRSRELDAGCSAVTIYELWLREMNRDEELFHTIATSSTIPSAAFTSDMALRVARWPKPLSRQQRLRLAADAMIAATAAILGATIYTRNPPDFTRFYTDVRSY